MRLHTWVSGLRDVFWYNRSCEIHLDVIDENVRSEISKIFLIAKPLLKYNISVQHSSFAFLPVTLHSKRVRDRWLSDAT